MVFSSLTFLVFFLPAVLLLYYCSSFRILRNAVLILFSLLFYAWGEPKWIFVLILTVFVNYLCGIAMAYTENKRLRTFQMLCGVVLGIGFLVYFKYSGMLVSLISGISGRKLDFVSPVLPIGISFYTFQILTYTIDVYRRKVEPQKNFFLLLLYVSFFPQLIAGPIVNYKTIQESLQVRHVSLEQFCDGLMRFLVGLSKKVMLANVCGELTENLGMTGDMSMLGAWLGALAYTLQIYFDFSGYSDMAIGMGEMFGFHFLENFQYPYVSTSVTDFWRRWHISLGAFFREYVYIPLGGNRVSGGKQIRNIMIVWGLTGLWHGASYNFLIWGLYYGVLLILEKKVFGRLKEKAPAFLNWLVTIFLVVLGWVIFYHTNLGDLWNHIKALFGVSSAGLADKAAIYYGKNYFGFLVIAVLACIPWKKEVLPIILKRYKKSEAVFAKSGLLLVLKAFVISLLALLSVGMLVGQSYNPFLYFRF
ncbi:MAG: MBOAT family O-acyltransferase [Acetatifactor sp.]